MEGLLHCGSSQPPSLSGVLSRHVDSLWNLPAYPLGWTPDGGFLHCDSQHLRAFRELASDRLTVCGTCQRIRRLKVGSQRNQQRHAELIFQLLYLEDTSPLSAMIRTSGHPSDLVRGHIEVVLLRSQSMRGPTTHWARSGTLASERGSGARVRRERCRVGKRRGLGLHAS